MLDGICCQVFANLIAFSSCEMSEYEKVSFVMFSFSSECLLMLLFDVD